MLLQRQLKKKQQKLSEKMKKNNDHLDAEKDAIEEDNSFIKDLSNGLKKKHQAKVAAIKSQEQVDELVANKQKEVKTEKKSQQQLESRLNKFGLKSNKQVQDKLPHTDSHSKKEGKHHSSKHHEHGKTADQFDHKEKVQKLIKDNIQHVEKQKQSI